MEARLQDLLERQYRELSVYFDFLVRQEETIRTGTIEQLEASVETDTERIAAIEALERAIVPLEKQFPAERHLLRHEKINEVRRQHRINRELLKERLSRTGARIHGLRIPRSGRSVYRDDRDSGGMLDLKM